MSKAKRARRAAVKAAQPRRRERKGTPGPSFWTAESARTKLPFYAKRGIFYVIGVLVLVGFLVAPAMGYIGQSLVGQPTQAGETSPRFTPPPKPVFPEAPSMIIDPQKAFRASLVTEKGTVKVELLPKEAPKAVNNFLFLAQNGFYDGLAFHEVKPGAWLRGGDPSGNGSGGPGYTLEEETSEGKHLGGVLATVKEGPNVNGSQFRLLLSAQPELDGQGTVFGRVMEGQDILRRLTPGDTIRFVTVEEGS